MKCRDIAVNQFPQKMSPQVNLFVSRHIPTFREVVKDRPSIQMNDAENKKPVLLLLHMVSNLYGANVSFDSGKDVESIIEIC